MSKNSDDQSIEDFIRESVSGADKRIEKELNKTKIQEIIETIKEKSSPFAKKIRRLIPGAALTAVGVPAMGVPMMLTEVVDEGTKNLTGKDTFGQWVAEDVTKLTPENKAYPVVRTVGEFLNPAWLGGAQLAERALNTTVTGGEKILKTTKNAINDKIVDNAFKSGKLVYGEPTTYTMFHHSNSPVTQFEFPHRRWDVVTHGADPNGVFGNLDKPIESGFMANRPFVSQWSVTAEKPLIQTGEVRGIGKNNIRNKIIARGRDEGADAVVFNGIKDNTLEGQNIIFATDKAGIQYKGGVGKVMYAGPTTGKTTYVKAHPEGVVVDMDRMGYELSIGDLRKRVAEKLGLDYRDPRVSDSPEYQKGFEEIINTWAQDARNSGKTLVGSSKALLRSDIPLNNTPYIPDYETFFARNQARGFKETPEQARQWYDSIIEAYPRIKIDNRYFSEIPGYESPRLQRVSIVPEESILVEETKVPRNWDHIIEVDGVPITSDAQFNSIYAGTNPRYRDSTPRTIRYRDRNGNIKNVEWGDFVFDETPIAQNEEVTLQWTPSLGNNVVSTALTPKDVLNGTAKKDVIPSLTKESKRFAIDQVNKLPSGSKVTDQALSSDAVLIMSRPGLSGLRDYKFVIDPKNSIGVDDLGHDVAFNNIIRSDLPEEVKRQAITDFFVKHNINAEGVLDERGVASWPLMYLLKQKYGGKLKRL